MPSAPYNTVPSTAIYTLAFMGVSLEAKVVALYAWTCPSRSHEGFFKLRLAYATGDLSLAPQQVLNAFDELAAIGMFMYDPRTETCLCMQALKFSPIKEGDNRLKGALRHLRQVEDSPLFQEFMELAHRYSPDLADAIRQEFPEAGFPTREVPSGSLRSHLQGTHKGRAEQRSSEEGS